jgi:uncharacterized small protein (DUF1192 family)
MAMSEEPAEPRSGRGALLTDLEREDLDFYGVGELTERIGRLQVEIARTEAKRMSKQSGRSAADSLFKF